jgi:hypothetical protein
MMKSGTSNTYVGIYEDRFGGMTYLGSVVKDGWIFGLIPETETCTGWTQGAMENLADKSQKEWEKYGYRVNDLPDDLRQRHARIHAAAVDRARALGWDPGGDEEDA